MQPPAANPTHRAAEAEPRSEGWSSRDRFLRAAACEPVDRTPIWLMRQAGRALPEYRALKEKHSFLDLVRTPALTVEVTLQPIRRFGFDAAVLFSDILVVAEALGQPFHFRDTGGIAMDRSLHGAADINRLDPGRLPEALVYVREALTLLRGELKGQTALLGFAGSPWTLANFMLEGGSADDYLEARRLFYCDRPLFHRLLEKLTAAVIGHLRLQLEAGVDAVQIFDSLGGYAPGGLYVEMSTRWMREIVLALPRDVPVIVFAPAAGQPWELPSQTGARILSVGWRSSLAEVKSRVSPQVALQGNLDPAVLTTTAAVVRRQAQQILEPMRGRPGHIFNLGHGLPPAADLGNIEALVETVRNYQ